MQYTCHVPSDMRPSDDSDQFEHQLNLIIIVAERSLDSQAPKDCLGGRRKYK